MPNKQNHKSYNTVTIKMQNNKNKRIFKVLLIIYINNIYIDRKYNINKYRSSLLIIQ